MQNFIIEFKQVFSPEYCSHLIQKFEESSQKQVGQTGSGVDIAKKDSMDLNISEFEDWKQECDNISSIIIKAAVEYTKLFPFVITGPISPTVLDPATGQTRTIAHEDISALDDQQIEGFVNSIFRLDKINLQRYTKGVGGYHHWHSEHYPHPTDAGQKTLHRVLLWLLYLNDVDEGGETDFFYQQARVKPSQGSLILAPCGFTHTHRGSVPQSSDKYVLASWIMYKDAAELYAMPE